jgi:hypothetical protein
LLPYLEDVWQYVTREPRPSLPASVRDSLVEASLATHKLVGTSHTKEMLSVLAKIQDLKLSGYLRMAIVTRESVRLRFQGDHDQSDVLIRDALKSINIDSEDIRLHYAYGRLLLSRSENAILCNNLSGARKCIENWYLNREYPSILELEVVRLKTTVLTRIDRYKGNF